MFDFDISLFMLNMCNTIVTYFDCSHLSTHMSGDKPPVS